MMVGVALAGVGAMVLLAFIAALIDTWKTRGSERGGHGAR